MKVCPACNRTFTEDHLSYCTSCGTPLVASSQSTSSSQPGQQVPDEDLMKTMLSPTPPSQPQSFSSLNEPAPPSPFGSTPSSFNDPTPSSSMETMIAPPSMFSDPGPSTPPSFNEPRSSSTPQSSPFYSEPTSSSKPFAEPSPQQSGSPFDAPYQPLFSGQQPIAPSGAFGQPSHPEWTPPPPPGQSWGAGGAVGMGAAYPQAQQQTLAIVSLVLGIVSVTIGLCCYLGFITGPAAIITGIIAMVQVKNNPMLYKGKGLAIGGIIMGVLYFVIFVLFFILGLALNIAGALAG